ncbi:VCBS repeat-containing protein, partial [Hyphomicrobiales bacterium]|nr:VCBS repeat-containing protein [Hyphomicrobiales bacterium]
MADYNGTDEDDIIDASALDSNIDKIYPGKGNDTITNAKSGQSIVASPGEDDISGQGYGYALWDSPQGGTVNLKEGWADDGFGTRDTISGVSTVLGSGKSDKFIGTSSHELFFPGNGNDSIDGGGGDDKVIYYNKNSSDYEISQVGDEFHIQQINGFLPTLDKVKDVRFIEFTGDYKTVDLNYYKAELKAELIKKVYFFEDDSVTPSRTYSNKFYPEGQVNYSPQGTYVLDINNDGIDDVVFPMFKAYATGADTSTAFIALTSSNGSLIFDDDINSTMPTSSGSRRSEGIKLVNSKYPAFVTVNHNTDAEDNRNNSDSIVPPSELNIVQSIFSSINQSDIIPSLPDSTEKHPFAVDAHSMAVGDINGDGLDDIFVGHWSGEKAYALIQGVDGVFSIQEQDFYKKIIDFPAVSGARQNFNILRDAGLVDVNGDGYDDLIAGFGYGGTLTTIYINNKGLFSLENKIELPASIYGSINQMSSKIMDADFDHDGDIDIAMLQIQLGDDLVNGYYAGNYIQILRNDGSGNYEDITNFIPENATQDAYLPRLNWNEPWQLIDLNNDNHIDIAGARAAFPGSPLIYLNDGEGRFEIEEIFSSETQGRVYAYGDFNGNNKIELVSFIQKKSVFEFYLYEVTDLIGTGPQYASSAKDGAPGFNERYYLNENSSAQEAVTSGTYETGLEHY